MNQQDVFKKIGGILKELNEQYDYLQNDTNQLHELELELFVANAHFLKDHSEILRKLNSQRIASAKPAESATVNISPPALPPAPVVAELPPPVTDPEPQKTELVAKPEPIMHEQPKTESFFKPEQAEPPKAEPVKPASVYEEKFFEPVVQQLKPVLDEEPAKVVEPPYVNSEAQLNAETEPEESTETIRHELVIDDADNWEDDDEPELFDEDIIDVEEEPEVVAEAPKTEPVKATPVEESKPLTINQIMSGQLAERKSQSQQAVTDLKSAITLNDKLLYVKDLFNGYSLAYSEAIEILNRFTSFAEAERFLNANYVNKNNWASKTATADKFYDLLRRRYS
jgi:hypothetical protein